MKFVNVRLIYLSGGMGNLSFEEQVSWRNEFKDTLLEKAKEHESVFKPLFFNPPYYYSTLSKNHKSEREAMEYDLFRLRESNVVVVNFNQPNSIGTAMELILAKELHIPVIGLNKDHLILHPWLQECCTRICDTMNEVVTHVYEYYLN